MKNCQATFILVSLLTLSITPAFAYLPLKVKPKITKAQAQKTAVAKAGKGKVVSSELETEKGKLVWSFDIKQGDIMKEVQIDATTGEVADIQTEDKAQQQEEKVMDKAEATVLRKYPGEVQSSTTEGTGASKTYVFVIKSSKGIERTIAVNAKTHKMVERKN